ncbi:MAG: TonB-dependent receptor, partial [Gammaproteobacteria bacterium]|nr:TonB-dependent receptor [Gammaproteobacteria bacterium]
IEDPCSDFNNGASQTVIDNCIAQGVPSDGSYEQLGGQISTKTGGTRTLEPETVDSFTFGLSYSPSWVDSINWVEGLTVEAMYYEHDLDRAIQAFDAQVVLNSCAETGEALFCDLIDRTNSGIINSFVNRLRNIGGIETDGFDLNIALSWPESRYGQFTAQWSNTFLNEYTEIIVDPTAPSGVQRRSLEGVEVNDRGKPEWKSTFALNWLYNDWSAAWTLRYIDEQIEKCSSFLPNSPDSLTALGLCSQPNLTDTRLSMNKLDSTIFNDLQVTYTPTDRFEGFSVTLGINNVLDEDPPACYSCSLNGYDPSTYDNPGRFTYIRANWKN